MNFKITEGRRAGVSPRVGSQESSFLGHTKE